MSLAIVPIIASLISRHFCKSRKFPHLVALIQLAQFSLERYFRFENFIMNINPRTSLIQKNLEGLYSLCGYLSIYLLASFIGEDLSLLKEPSQYSRFRNRFFLINFILLIISVILWSGGIEPSRRCANMAYVAWTCTICGWQLFILFINEWTLGTQATKMITLETLAKHQLAIFLVANLLTGLINVKLKPLMMDWKECLFVMISYNLSLLKLNKLLG